MSPLAFAVACVLAALCGILLSPAEALAWGPVTHLVHGAQVLGRLDALPPDVATLLGRFPYEYLYGCIGADIIQAKKFTRSLYTHCHHWRTGWTVLESARTDAERAFARGYLSHLASDTFSHNYYLPVRLIGSFRATSIPRFACTYTWQPSVARRRLIAAPMPPLPPVTRAFFIRAPEWMSKPPHS